MALFSIDDKLDTQSDFSIDWHYSTFFHHPHRSKYIADDVFTGHDLSEPVDLNFNPLVVSTLEIFSYLTETYPDNAESLNKQIFKSLFDDYLQHVQKEKDHIDRSKQYAEDELDQIRPYTSGAVYAINLGVLIQGIDIDQSEETWKSTYENKVLSAAKCVMWGNDIVSALKEKEQAGSGEASITNNVIVHERLNPDEDPYLHVIQRYNQEVINCLSINLPMPTTRNTVKSDKIIKGWISQLVWALCIPRYNNGIRNVILYHLLKFSKWLDSSN